MNKYVMELSKLNEFHNGHISFWELSYFYENYTSYLESSQELCSMFCQ